MQAVELGTSSANRARSTTVSKNATMPLKTASPARRSPFLQPRKSPALVATAPKSPVQPLRTRLIQMLALESLPEAEMMRKLKTPFESISTILKDLAVLVHAQWQLKDENFHEVKSWDWKGYTSAERATVIGRASQAFDRLHLSSRHPSRIRLVHPDKRGSVDNGDTSPMSLTNTVGTYEGAMENDKKGSAKTSPLKIVHMDGIEHQPWNCEVPEKRKITAKGLLTAGSKAAPKVVKDTVSAMIAGKAKTKFRMDSDASGRALQNESSSTSRYNVSNKVVSDRSSLQVNKQGIVESLLPDLRDVDGPRSSSPTSTRADEPPRQLQTPTVVSTIKAALARSSSGSIDDDVPADRTSSITSSTTDRSDQSLLSTVSAVSSASTAPSLTSEPTTEKRRSKFLTINKRASGSVSDIASRATSRTVSPVPKSTSSTQKEEVHTPLPSPKKRKVEFDSGDALEVKRSLTDDLQQMNMDCNRMYTEYKALHDRFCTKVGDVELFDKFLSMHNKISNWRNTFMSE